MGNDREERARVRSRIGKLILEFCARQTSLGASFYMEELRKFVEMSLVPGNHIAPDSPGRILRQLRQQRHLDYKVISRKESFYRFVPVERPAEQAELFAARAS